MSLPQAGGRLRVIEFLWPLHRDGGATRNGLREVVKPWQERSLTVVFLQGSLELLRGTLCDRREEPELNCDPAPPPALGSQ